jgi:hypothetical protein
MECLWFSFSKCLQKEFDKVREHWNSHYIRRSRHDTIPGIPDILYYLPKQLGSTDCIVPVSVIQTHEMETHCDMDVEENIYKEYFEFIMENKGWQYPVDAKDSFNLFQNFKQLQNNI